MLAGSKYEPYAAALLLPAAGRFALPPPRPAPARFPLLRRPPPATAPLASPPLSTDLAHAVRLTKYLVRAASAPVASPSPRSSPRPRRVASPPPALGVLFIALSQMALLDDGLVKAHWFDHVWELFDQMLGRGIAPSVVTYSTLFNACRHQGDIAKDSGEMARKGMCPDEFTCTIVVRGACYDRQVEVATRFLQVMWQSGIALNAAAFNALIDEYCKNGNLQKLAEALVTCTRMSEVGIELNVVTYSLIDWHSKKRKV
ncbi:hypothetical protein GUJ93_ZPchr0009g1814 [Zizania palustris]|uniref:Pentacotripeptide-repeat region of PRORP domain-containing protein n=1 Tax=Zizania palustris TaxID=103762 RepID=A0A8J5R361_ZIZPA|nr:hypothetical protein GUJ93_ZPchr0009g1814 [Zizania palustris]